MDLALNNLQRLICLKTNQPTNQPTYLQGKFKNLTCKKVKFTCEQTFCSLRFSDF